MDASRLVEEADVKLAELKKEQYEFRREVQHATRSGKPLAVSDQELRWTEDRLRLKEYSLTDKLNTKNQQLHILI